MSIEETNRIRVALGMKPLPVPGAGPSFKEGESSDSDSDSEEEQGSTLESRQAEAHDNWKKLQTEAESKKKREVKKEAIKRAADEAKRLSKLEGKGLGEADEETEQDTKTWLLGQKKRQKKLEKQREKARKLEEELLAREQAEYTSKDLAGVRVAHELGDFEDEGEHVLVLKDTTIDENEEEGDELENLDLRDKERLNERLELKKKKPVYNPNDLEDGEKGMLQHYDETIDGKKRKRFTLDAQGSTAEEADSAQQGIGGTKPKSLAISLEILNDLPVSDYREDAEVKIRKPKKKKAKTLRQRNIDEDIVFPIEAADPGGMEVDSGTPAPPKKRYDNMSFVDDEDLQASLAKQRRETLKKRKKITPADIARQIREEQAVGTPRDDDQPEEVGLIIDETSEFLSGLQRPNEESKPKKAKTETAASSWKPESAIDSGLGTTADEVARNAAEANGLLAKNAKVESDEDSDVEMDDIPPQQEPQEAQQHVTDTGLEEEATHRPGLGSTFKMLRERGILEDGGGDSLNRAFLTQQRFLAEKAKREAAAEAKARLQRARDRASGKLDRLSAREREEYARRENKNRDQAEAQQMSDLFNANYKPNVNLKYIDEFGRDMNQKEAFKHLSHQFHGKGSGKMKTEKRLKKIEMEKEKSSRSGLYGGVGYRGLNMVAGMAAKRDKTFGVRLA